MDVRKTVARYYAEWVDDKGASWTECMTKALEDQAATHAHELRAYEATVANLEQRIRELEAERVTEDLPYWPPCNPGCDPEFNGCRSKGCATLCEPARKAMLAAAPDLLDALKDALCCLEVCGKDYDYAVGKARAAIAKATGETE